MDAWMVQPIGDSQFDKVPDGRVSRLELIIIICNA